MVKAARTALLALMGASLLGLASAAAQTPDALTERYRDWTVRCVTPKDNERRCWMVQALTREGSQDRLMQAELTFADKDPKLVFLAPLGLLLSAGLQTAIDEQPAHKLAFNTCLPAGCVVREDLSTTELANMRRGQKMSVAMVVAQTKRAVDLTISLSGFSAAYDRLAALSRK